MPDASKRQPPVSIPLDFDTAIDGLLRVPPPPKPETPKPVAKKRPPRTKKPAKE